MPTNTLQEELEEIAKKAIDWHGYYDEAKALMPEWDRQFVDTTAWAGEKHNKLKAKLVADAIIAAFQARLPKKQTIPYAQAAQKAHEIIESRGWNAYADAVNEVLGGTE